MPLLAPRIGDQGACRQPLRVTVQSAQNADSIAEP
jgi:hypothetical protein